MSKTIAEMRNNMEIVGKINSYNKATNKDCFGNGGPSTDDHIWPEAKEGSSARENIQMLSFTSNLLKGDETKGQINNIRFSIKEVGRSDANLKIGRMYIKLNKGWLEVIPTK